MTSYQHAGAFSPLGDSKPPFSMLRRDVGGDQGSIWRARSFDEAHSSMETSAERSDENHRDSEGDMSSALHSSFDAAFLGNSRVDRSLFGFDDGKQDPQPSWEEEGDPSLGELSGRKHAAETTEVIQPRTVRKKVARRDASNLDTKTIAKSRLIPPGSAMKKCLDDFTPSSAVKRRRAPLPQRKSPMRRVDPLIPSTLPFASSNSFTPKTGRNDGGSFFGAGVASGIGSAKVLQTLTPTRPDGPSSTMKSTSRFQNTGTTAGSTHMETTIESDSVDTSSPTTTRFRFTSFPASLPRVNNPRDRQCPDSVRKRMSFGDGGLNEANCNQSRDDDGTQNTSISSLSDGGQQQTQSAPNKPPSVLEWKNRQEMISHNVDHDDGVPVHAQLFPDEENFGYSDSDDDSTASPVLRGIVGRTRLNFNIVLTPPGHDAKQAQKGDLGLMPLDLNMDLERPYDQGRITSFQSSISSAAHLHDVSGFGEIGSALTPSRPVQKGMPQTPGEVQLHFQLDAQCSPIPGIPEEQGDCVSERRRQAAGDMMCTINDEGMLLHGKSRSKESMVSGDSKSKEEASTGSESTNGKMRRLRPMPDISAFESVVQSPRDLSADDSATVESNGIHSSPRLMCPPTPVRTPAWANESGGHVFFGGRQNSLITTKVLLACPSQVLEGRSSLESSLLDDDSKSSTRAHRRESYGSTGPRAETKEESDRRRDSTSDFSFMPSRSQEDFSMHTKGQSGPDSNVKTPQFRPPGPSKGVSRNPNVSLAGDLSYLTSFSSDFDTLSVLGSGAFADVYKVRSRRDGKLYAVKRNRRQFRGKRDRDMAMSEVRSMQRLQSVCAETGANIHEKNSYSLYLLFFYRAWQEDGYFLVQTELCCRDTCREMVDSLRFQWNSAKKKYPSLLRNLKGPDGVEPGSEMDLAGRALPNITLWKICHDVAAGLSHIHAHGVVHQDIKPSNIFFTVNVRFGAMCKIGDFGMSGDIGTSGDGQEGDTKYVPPELLSSGVRHPSADIFSLGLTLYEIATNHHIELPSEGPRWHELRNGKPPDLSPYRESELMEVIQLMTGPCVGNRPTADSLLENEKVKSAGHGYDLFLQEYILDVEEFDRIEEERLARDRKEDQTPRTGPHRSGVRSPSFAMMLPSAPILFSPGAHTSH